MITPSEQKTLNFIRNHIEQHDYSPSYAEIALGIGISSKGVAHRYVQALIDKGYLSNNPGRHHSLQINGDTTQSKDAYSIPLLGKIAAGRPIEAIPDEDEINLADFFMGPGRFALKVQGSSMIEAGILDGDVAIIKQQSVARNGEIIVALIDNNEATLKSFQKMKDGNIKLTPANRDMQVMIYTADRVQIQGVLVGSMRRY
jgi:repressor LexA